MPGAFDPEWDSGSPTYDFLCRKYQFSNWAGLWHIEDPFCTAWDIFCGALEDWDPMHRTLEKIRNLPDPFA